MLKKFASSAFLVSLLTFAITFFTRDRYDTVKDIVPAVLEQPRQTSRHSYGEIVFSRNGLDYHLTPLYEYDMTGLVMGKKNYRFWGIFKVDEMFPYDLCVIWGGMADRGVNRERGVRFYQEGRFCYACWDRDPGVDFSEMANNHLLVNDPEIGGRLKTVMRGDQVRVRGKLVDVNVWQTGDDPAGSQPRFTWKTSVTRDDRGDGACEVIFVEGLEIVQKGNALSFFLFGISVWGMAIAAVMLVIGLFAKNLGDDR